MKHRQPPTVAPQLQRELEIAAKHLGTGVTAVYDDASETTVVITAVDGCVFAWNIIAPSSTEDAIAIANEGRAALAQLQIPNTDVQH